MSVESGDENVDESEEEAKADAKALISQIKQFTGLWEDDPDEVRTVVHDFYFIKYYQCGG